MIPTAAFVALVGAACQSARTGGTAEGENRQARPAAGTSQEADEGRDEKAGVCERRGPWSCTHEAEWLRHVLEVSGHRVAGTTGSALIGRGRRSRFFVWTTESARPIRETAEPAELLGRFAGVPIYGDRNRLVWRAQGLNVWLERGPRGDSQLPQRGKLATLVLVTKRLPRTRTPVELMPMPAAALRRCRRSELMRPACPARVPRVSLTGIEAGVYHDFPNRDAHAFNLQWGGEYRGTPELNRPPGMLHLVILAGSRVSSPFALTTPTPIRDGVIREPRNRGILFPSVRWAGRRGVLVLAPPYGLGGVEGNHLIFRWSEGDTQYALSLHAWEPFRETVATLRRVIASLPPEGS
ncbi:MAG: hypothetical protein M3327_05590 [Actinomycetota bacterium]|nr:hypothetical protein [Actinomycetota bacterium]